MFSTNQSGQLRKALPVQVSHGLAASSAVFDEDHLVSCAGLVPVVDGHARVLGCDLRTDRRRVRPRVGLLAHATGLYDELTVEANVGFWARASGCLPADVEAALSRMGLAGRLRTWSTSGKAWKVWKV